MSNLVNLSLFSGDRLGAKICEAFAYVSSPAHADLCVTQVFGNPRGRLNQVG